MAPGAAPVDPAALSAAQQNPLAASGASASLTYLARAGYAAKGIIFLTLGLLAANGAIRSGDQAAPLPVDQRLAVRAIHHGPLGSILVAGLCVGLLCYSAWQAMRAIVDPERHGRRWHALIRRGWYLWLALLNLVLAVSAAALSVGLAWQGVYHVGNRSWTLIDLTSLLSTGPVRHLFVIAGLITLVYGMVRGSQAIALQWQAVRKRDVAQRQRRWRRRAQRLNLAGRGAIALGAGTSLLLIGGYFNSGHDLQRAYDVYQHLLHERVGRNVLIVVAAALLSWGIYCLLRATRHTIGSIRKTQLSRSTLAE